MPGRRLLVAFAAWTLFVWTTRIGTATDEGAWGRVALAVVFTLVGVALLVVAWRARGRALTATEAVAVRLAAAWTVGVWVVRAVGIALADHEVGFIVVHVVLAVVSIALAVATVRSSTLGHRHGTAGHRRAEVDVTS